MTDPQPYRPFVSTARGLATPLNDDTRRPWLAQRPFETFQAWTSRVSHTCCWCGHYDEDMDALDVHESQHFARSSG